MAFYLICAGTPPKSPRSTNRLLFLRPSKYASIRCNSKSTGRSTDYFPQGNFGDNSRPLRNGNDGGKNGGSGGGGGGRGGEDGDDGGPFGWLAALLAPLTALLDLYRAAIDSTPLLTKMLTAATTNFLGDLLAQLLTTDHLNLRRTLQFTALGFLLIGPALHLWYGTLSRLVPTKGTTAILTKLLLDRGLFTPVMIASVFSVLLTINGKQDLVWSKLQHDVLPTWMANAAMAIPVQFINFGFINPAFQVAFIQSAGVLFKVILSYQAHKGGGGVVGAVA